MKKIASSLFVAGLLVSAISASAQIDALYAFQTGHTTESLVLGATAYSASTFNKVNCNWSSPTTPASLSAGGTITAGPNDGASINGFTGPRITSSLTWNMANASGRSVIRGKNNNGGTTPSALIVGMTSSRSVQVVIWGPTSVALASRVLPISRGQPATVSLAPPPTPIPAPVKRPSPFRPMHCWAYTP